MNNRKVADLMPKGTMFNEDEWWSYNQVKQVGAEYAKLESIDFLKALQKQYDWDNLDIRDADSEELYQLYKDGEE